MGMQCDVCGKKPVLGNQKTYRGKAKYLGGVGTKVTGVTARKFKPNIQKVRALVDGRIVRIKVSAKAIRNGMVVKPPRRERIASSSVSSCLSPARSHSPGSCRHWVISPFAIPQLPSGWNWSPAPG